MLQRSRLPCCVPFCQSLMPRHIWRWRWTRDITMRGPLSRVSRAQTTRRAIERALGI